MALVKLNIRTLNSHEREAIKTALEYYIINHGKGGWSQKVILDEMLSELLWCDKLQTI